MQYSLQFIMIFNLIMNIFNLFKKIFLIIENKKSVFFISLFIESLKL